MAIFEDEDGTDGAGALGNALKSLEKLEWDDNDIPFFFNKAETRMKIAEVKKNFTKFQVLSEILPKKVQDQTKSILRKGEAEFPEKNAYKLLKLAVLRIFGPRKEDGMERALARVMSGKPSELARTLVDDMCKKELDCACCSANVAAMWKRQLPSQVRAGIAHTDFTMATFEAIVQLADDIHSTTANAVPVTAAVSSMAAIQAPASLNETQPGLQYPIPQISAIRGRGCRGGRNRGGRGNRGRGGASQPQPPKHRGTKHPDLPAGEWKGCGMHFKWGRGSYFCSEPQTCPWKDVYAAKPSKQ